MTWLGVLGRHGTGQAARWRRLGKAGEICLDLLGRVGPGIGLARPGATRQGRQGKARHDRSWSDVTRREKDQARLDPKRQGRHGERRHDEAGLTCQDQAGQGKRVETSHGVAAPDQACRVSGRSGKAGKAGEASSDAMGHVEMLTWPGKTGEARRVVIGSSGTATARPDKARQARQDAT